jgi:hypothetical protein
VVRRQLETGRDHAGRIAAGGRPPQDAWRVLRGV